MRYFKLKNWSKYQHYKDRNPPWIKLHFELLSSTDWVCLDDASRVLAIASMLIASRNDGRVPDNAEYMKRVAYLNKKPNFKPLIDCGFIQLDNDASNTLADASTIQADARPETETETETETKGIAAYRPEWFSEDLWKEFIKNRKLKKLSNSELALTTVCNSIKEGVDNGYSLEKCVSEYVSSKWNRFDYRWIKKGQGENKNNEWR